MSRMDTHETPHAPESESDALPPEPARKISSQHLLGEEGKVIIDHDGQEYVLRKTQAGKLLLTK